MRKLLVFFLVMLAFLTVQPADAGEAEWVRFEDTFTLTGGLRFSDFAADDVEETVGITFTGDYGLSERIRAGLNYEYYPADIEVNDEEHDLSLHGISAVASFEIGRADPDEDEREEEAEEASNPERTRQAITAGAGYYEGTIDNGDEYDVDGEMGYRLSFRLLHNLASDVIIDAEAGYRRLDMDVPDGYTSYTDDMDLSGAFVSVSLGYQF